LLQLYIHIKHCYDKRLLQGRDFKSPHAVAFHDTMYTFATRVEFM